jgi:hypothetical protein
MIKRIEDMTHRIALGDEQNKTSIMAKDLEIEKLKNRNELLAKELEIQKLKVELLGLKKTKK